MIARNVNRMAIAGAALGFLAACSKGGVGEDKAKTDATVGVAPSRAQGAVNSGPAGEMGDANIFYALDAANMGDSVKGALASTKGTSAEVRAFGKMMVLDHHTMRQQGQDLAKRLAMQPTPPAGDSLPSKFENAISKLTSAAKGRDFDKAYMDHEVASHRELLAMAVAAMSATRNSEIKNFIQNSAPVIQAHLDRAATIQKNLQK